MPTWLSSSLRFSSIIICSLALAACGDGAPKFRSTDITGVDYGKALDLPDTSGRVRRLEEFRGKAVVLFFGFTHCPDVCPTTLADIARITKGMERVQPIFVSVDPERDTPQQLEKYVKAFDPRIIALRGDLPATQRLAKDFKIYFEKRKTGDTYSIDHSSQTYVIDPQGRLRLLVRPDRLAADLGDDLRTLLKEG